MKSPQEIAISIKNAANIRGMSVNRILIESGAGAGLIGNLNQGKEPSALRLAMVADYLGIPIDEIMGTKKPVRPTGERDELIEKTLQIINGLDEEHKTMALDYIVYLQNKQNQIPS